jgi:hypothetical protein
MRSVLLDQRGEKSRRQTQLTNETRRRSLTAVHHAREETTMFAIRKGNTITIAPLEDALVGLQSGWAIRFADKPQFLFHISRMNLDGSKMTMNQAIENCARIARREGLDLRSNACNATLSQNSEYRRQFPDCAEREESTDWQPPAALTEKPLPAIAKTMLARMSPVQLECRRFDGLVSAVDELIRLDESRTDEKLLQAIAAADAEADARDEGDTREEESLEDHNIQGLGAYRDVFDAGGEQ